MGTMRSVQCAALIPIIFSPLLACAGTPTSPSSTNNTSASQSAGAVSLLAADWETISAPAAFPLNNDSSGRLLFDFPTVGSINYLYNVRPPKEVNGSLSISVQITTTGPVMFNYMTEPFNTCATPASVRPFIWANRNSFGEFDRWWSNPGNLPLGPGSATLKVQLEPDRWSSVNGKLGNADSAAQAGFSNALKNVSSLGLTFGGGYFFGHGINVQGGSARFAIVSYQVG